MATSQQDVTMVEEVKADQNSIDNIDLGKMDDDDLSGSSVDSDSPKGTKEDSQNTSNANASMKQSEEADKVKAAERNTFKLNLFKKKINLNREQSFKFRVDQNSVNSGLECMSGAHSSGSLQSEVDQLFRFRKENRDIGDRFIREDVEGSGGVNPRNFNFAQCFTFKIQLEKDEDRKALFQTNIKCKPGKKNSNEALNKWSGKGKFEILLGK